jgi:excisionase family DNA binding protein
MRGMDTIHDATTTGQSFEILTRTELAQRFKCSKRHIDGLQHQGMPCIMLGRSRRFILTEVLAWLKRKGGRA